MSVRQGPYVCNVAYASQICEDFTDGGNRGTERSRSFSKVAQLVNGRARAQPRRRRCQVLLYSLSLRRLPNCINLVTHEASCPARELPAASMVGIQGHLLQSLPRAVDIIHSLDAWICRQQG